MSDKDYEAFVDKFKPKKTTDDCYTPAEVYDAVLRFAGRLADLGGRPVVRPFYPGGDYERYDYPENCVVIDNPPFSVYSKIVRFYLSRGIDFFLFAPTLTLPVKDADCCFIVTGSKVTYENGAEVNTSFATNLVKDLRLWVCPELREMIEEAQREKKTEEGKRPLPVYAMPDNVVTAARLGKYARGGMEIRIKRESCAQVRKLDNNGKLYGGGFLVSDSAGRMIREKAERMEREKAEQARRSVPIEFSARERAIVERLNGEEEKLKGKN